MGDGEVSETTQRVKQILIHGDGFEGRSSMVAPVVKAIFSSDFLRVSKSFAARKEQAIDLGRVREILPLSGQTIRVKQLGKGQFSIRTSNSGETDRIWEDEGPKKKLQLDIAQTKAFFELLHLTQLTLLAHTERAENAPGKLALPKVVINGAEILENRLQDRSDHQEIEAAKQDLVSYHEDWYNLFNSALARESLGLAEGHDAPDFFSEQYERNFIRLLSDKNNLQPRDYLDEPVSDSINDYVQETLMHGLGQMYTIPEPSSLGIDVGWELPSIKLRLAVKVDLYKKPREEVQRLLSLVGTNNEQAILKDQVEEIKQAMNDARQIKSLIQNPPAVLMRKLESILMQGSFEEIMEARLKSLVPGIYNHRKNNSEGSSLDIKQVFSETEEVRNEVMSLESVLDRIDNHIDGLRNAQDARTEVNRLQEKWAVQKRKLTEVKNKPQNEEKTKTELIVCREKITSLSYEMKKNQSNIKTDASVLWLGLGQAGQSILRECLLYCLDNLNDARCSALIRALGIRDIHELKNKILVSKSSDNDKRRNAEHLLRQLFDRELHILAMNLGGEVDDLVEEDQPGFFLWGEEKEESEYSSVRRKTKNTIKLDPIQDGTGGETGVGRAFAFGRDNEIKEALREVGRKNNNSPSHIIVTHSFPGGSGSGMVLPVLQMLRSQFDSDAMIWVISVGEGRAEKRTTAKFNTPFILSDILQAHYDGIHAAIDPFRVGEWDVFKMELSGHMRRMENIMIEIQNCFEEETTLLKSVEESDITKAKQLRKDREQHLRKFSTIKELEKLPPSYKEHLSKSDEGNLGLVENEWKYDFNALLELLPYSDQHTEAFNLWCDEYDSNGERPALKFWSWWVNQASDPLGTLVDCRERSKQQRNDKKKDGDAGFLPHITSAHLEWALTQLEIKLFGKSQGEEFEESEKKSNNEPPSIRMLIKYLNDQLTKIDGLKKSRESFDSVKEKLQAYGREVDGFNALRRDLTLRVRTLSKAGNDKGIKSIIISNAHLERGVSMSQIPVEENTYTVYNAVVFDIIMNIIGSQLDDKEFQKGKMEYFDRQDLNNQTKPPMVVGLLQQNDALSLAEPPVSDRELRTIVRKMGSNIGITELFDRLFMNQTKTLVDEIPNPFASNDFSSGGWASYFFSSFFGIRSHYMLQFNPYELAEIKPTEHLEKIINLISTSWDNEDALILDYTYEERQSFIQTNITSLTLVNMIRWLTLVERKTLQKWMKIKNFSSKGEIEKLIPQRPEFRFSEVQGNYQLSAYEEDSGYVNMGHLGEIFCKLGLFTEELLAAAPPSLLSSYLPQMIMEDRREEIVNSIKEKISDDANKKYSVAIINSLLKGYHPTTIYDSKSTSGFQKVLSQLDKSGDFDRFVDVLSQFNLDIKFVVDREGQTEMKLCLHPRLTRYLSVFRDIVLTPGSALFPSKSAAGNLSRYLTPDSSQDVIGTYGSPTFVRGVSALERMGFIGLLPDEQRFTWPSFCRMVLFSNQNNQVFFRSMGDLAKVSKTDLERFKPLLVRLTEEASIDTSLLKLDSGPKAIIELGKTLHARLLATKDFCGEYKNQHPNEMSSVEHWEKRIDAIKEKKIEIYDESTLLYFSQYLLNLVGIGSQGSSPNDAAEPLVDEDKLKINAVDQEKTTEHENQIRDDIAACDRLLYELAVNLNEMLTQAEYMSKDHSADRVHFQMNGFSDRLIGVPSSLLVQVHTSSTYREDFDAAKFAIRNSITEALGEIRSSKEFQTKSVFGPRASVTMTLAQAPLNEAASKFNQVMRELSGNDPESYVLQSKLHPYVFLYNILWLSARIDAWTSTDNVEFARRFVIPLQVIQDHYSRPERIDGAVITLAKDQVFLGGVSIPQDDIRDYKSSSNPDERYRSMLHLLSILALRHVKACESFGNENENFNKSFVEMTRNHAFSSLIDELKGDPLINRKSESFTKGNSTLALLLQGERIAPSQSDEGLTESVMMVDEDEDEFDLDDILDELDNEDNDTGDTIIERTKAWLKAYESWKKWTMSKGDESE